MIAEAKRKVKIMTEENVRVKDLIQLFDLRIDVEAEAIQQRLDDQVDQVPDDRSETEASLKI